MLGKVLLFDSILAEFLDLMAVILGHLLNNEMLHYIFWEACIFRDRIKRFGIANDESFLYALNQTMIALQKLLKIFFISSKKPFSYSRYSNFCISVFPSFSPC